MNFDLRAFLKETLLDMVGYKPDREIKYAASKWYDKGNLEEVDLAEIEAKIEEQYKVVEDADIYGYLSDEAKETLETE